MVGILVAEVNESMPRLLGGYDECIHLSQVDHVVENNHYGIYGSLPSEPSEVDIFIAQRVAELIEDELTIQLAHPYFREELEKQAGEFNIIPKGIP